MSVLDVSRFPIVRFSTMPGDVAATETWISELEQLLQRDEPFALVYPPLPQPMPEPSPDQAAARRTFVLWFKRNREAFRARCRALIMTAAEQQELPLYEAMLPALNAMYQVPVELACGDDAADQHALSHLAT